MYQVITYGFPLILVAFEWGLKFVMKVENTSFAGPALAAAALSFLMPLTKPKVIEVNIQGHPNTFLTTNRDSQIVGFTWILVFAFLFLWAISCFLTTEVPIRKIWKLDMPFAIGAGVYLFSLVMIWIKEKF